MLAQDKEIPYGKLSEMVFGILKENRSQWLDIAQISKLTKLSKTSIEPVLTFLVDKNFISRSSSTPLNYQYNNFFLLDEPVSVTLRKHFRALGEYDLVKESEVLYRGEKDVAPSRARGKQNEHMPAQVSLNDPDIPEDKPAVIPVLRKRKK
jgi:hypothetical protein